MRILQYDSKRMPQIVFFDFVDINAVITDFTILYIIKTIDQIGNRCLSGAGRADKRDLLSRRRVQVHIMKHNFFRHVSKVHIIEHNVSGQLGIGNRPFLLVRMFPGPKSGTHTSRRLHNLSVFFFCIYKRYVTFVCFQRFV